MVRRLDDSSSPSFAPTGTVLSGDDVDRCQGSVLYQSSPSNATGNDDKIDNNMARVRYDVSRSRYTVVRPCVLQSPTRIVGECLDGRRSFLLRATVSASGLRVLGCIRCSDARPYASLFLLVIYSSHFRGDRRGR